MLCASYMQPRSSTQVVEQFQGTAWGSFVTDVLQVLPARWALANKSSHSRRHMDTELISLHTGASSGSRPFMPRLIGVFSDPSPDTWTEARHTKLNGRLFTVAVRAVASLQLCYTKCFVVALFNQEQKRFEMAIFKQRFSRTIRNNVREPQLKMWGFKTKKGQKVHPNRATNFAMEFHYHIFCAHDLSYDCCPGWCNVFGVVAALLVLGFMVVL